MDEIARVAGYNKSLIFQYFGDKQNLYVAVIRRVRETSDAAFLRAMNASALKDLPMTAEMLRTTLRASAAWVFDHFLEHPRYLKLFTWEMSADWKIFREASQPLEPSFELGLQLLNRAKSLGLLRQDIAPETVIANMLSLPMMTLAAIPRFAGLRERAEPDHARSLDTLREQTLRFVLHAALPD